MTLVYPPKTYRTSSETIFFIGSANHYCLINQMQIDLNDVGNFCPVFDLNLNDNLFEVDIDGVRHEVKIFREPIQLESKPYEFKEYNGQIVSNTFSTICLDPGHGGPQYGTCSPKGIKEKDLNLKLAFKIKSHLEKAGFRVVLTRDSDLELSLEERVSIAKTNNCDLFISIHHNAIPDNQNPIEHHGISAHYYYEHSRQLAFDLSSALALELGLKNNGAIQQNLFVTRENYFSQAILLECGYLIHPVESELIIQDSFQEKLAKYLSKFLKN